MLYILNFYNILHYMYDKICSKEISSFGIKKRRQIPKERLSKKPCDPGGWIECWESVFLGHSLWCWTHWSIPPQWSTQNPLLRFYVTVHMAERPGAQRFLEVKKNLFCSRVKCWWVEAVIVADVVTLLGKKSETVCSFRLVESENITGGRTMLITLYLYQI